MRFRFLIGFFSFFSLVALAQDSVDLALSASEKGDFNTATSILKKLDNSEPYVIYAWGVVFRNGGNGNKPDLSKALKYFEKSANDGNKEAQYTLALIYQHGDGVSPNPQKAIRLYEQSSAQGFDYATFNLASRYYAGDLVDRDYQKAMKLFILVANKGMPKAERMVGLMYLKGEGVTPNLDEAENWFQKAAYKGLPSAQNNMGLLWYGYANHRIDLVKSYAWFDLAYKNGYHDDDKDFRAIVKSKLTTDDLIKSQKIQSTLTSSQ